MIEVYASTHGWIEYEKEQDAITEKDPLLNETFPETKSTSKLLPATHREGRVPEERLQKEAACTAEAFPLMLNNSSGIPAKPDDTQKSESSRDNLKTTAIVAAVLSQIGSTIVGISSMRTIQNHPGQETTTLQGEVSISSDLSDFSFSRSEVQEGSPHLQNPSELSVSGTDVTDYPLSFSVTLEDTVRVPEGPGINPEYSESIPAER